MADFFMDIAKWIASIFFHWQAYVTGGGATAILQVWERLSGRQLSRKTYAQLVFGAFLFVAVFLTWREEHRAASTLEGAFLEPVLRVEPERSLISENRVFTLHLVNTGVPRVEDIEIFEDYFVVLKSSGELRIYPIGPLLGEPNTRLPVLNRGEKTSFILDTTKIHRQLTDFYANPPEKGDRMRVVRLLLKYRRSSDGKQFSFSKLFVIGGDGEALFDYDFRGIQPIPSTLISLEEIKSVLGITN